MGTINLPKSSHFGYMKIIKCSPCACLCKGDWDSDREVEVKLEEKILEFMEGTNKPSAFPTKDELIEAGRRDLVEAIVKRRDWLSMGWDLEEGEKEIKGVSDGKEKSEENGETGSDSDEGFGGFGEDSSWDSTSFSHTRSSSGRSFEMRDEVDDIGVEGILTRLEKERNISLSRYNSDDWPMETPKYVASQVSYSEEDAPMDGIIALREASSQVLAQEVDNKKCDVRTRLQQLEFQLASTLSSLRSKSKELIPKEGNENLVEIEKLSDALEFQETEIMNAKDRLRTIRAKVAVSEGKVTLAIIDARKAIDVKQRKIESIHRAMQHLRSTSIVWANSASEVLLVGSFDGWTTRRRMKKSRSGVFSLDLKLYPGKYEIKFIVDGEWKVDPLRPIVKTGGYENNLFIVA